MTRFDAYCIHINSLLDSLWNCRRNDSAEKIGDIVEQIVYCLSAAENAISMLSQIDIEGNLYRACLPIIDMVCYNGVGSLKTRINEDAVLKLYYYVVAYMERNTALIERSDGVSKRFEYFQILFDEVINLDQDEIFARNAHRSFFGRNDDFETAIQNAKSDYLDGNEEFDGDSSLRLTERSELVECYMERFENEVMRDGYKTLIDEIVNDSLLNTYWKISILYRAVCELGFNPSLWDYYQRTKTLDQCDDSVDDEIIHSNCFFEEDHNQNCDELNQRCALKENQEAARTILDYLMPMVEKEDIIDYEAAKHSFQALMVACSMDDHRAISKYTEAYFTYALHDLSFEQYETELYFQTLQLIAKPETARAFITRGIELLEAETKRQDIHCDDLYALYDALIILTACIDDAQKTAYFKELQQKVLGLGFEYIQ